jgi:hypothetical protein
MGNWWIDESPYPGPAYDLTSTPIFPRKYSPTTAPIGPIVVSKQVAKLIFETYKAGMVKVGAAALDAAEVLKHLGVAIYPDPILERRPPLPPSTPEPDGGWQGYDHFQFSDAMTEAERRKHALLCRKYRNTGPTVEWGFERNGKRTT